MSSVMDSAMSDAHHQLESRTHAHTQMYIGPIGYSLFEVIYGEV